MEQLLNYSSDSESNESQNDNNIVKNKDKIDKSSKENEQQEEDEPVTDLQALVEAEGLGVDYDLDISDLENRRKIQKRNKFYKSNQVTTRKNHVTGHVEEYHLSAAKFHEQFHTFKNFGHAQDPTVNRGGHIVTAEGYRDVKLNNDAHGPKSRDAKEYKQTLRRKRKKAGEAGEEDFLGPWAFYEGEEDFRQQRVVPTEEQEKMKEEFENKRKQKIEEKQREDGIEQQFKNQSDEEDEEAKK